MSRAVAGAYLVAYNADELINWSYDQQGELQWVVIRTSLLKQDDVKTFGWKPETRWIYYDREKFEIYERQRRRSEGDRPGRSGRHGFAGIGRVPVFELRVSEGLWLTNKIALLQLEHFNKSKPWLGLDDGPVRDAGDLFGARIEPDHRRKLLSAAGAEDRFGWTEPAGNVLPSRRITWRGSRTRSTGYRYLMQQAGDGSGSTAVGVEPAMGLQRDAGDSAGIR